MQARYLPLSTNLPFQFPLPVYPSFHVSSDLQQTQDMWGALGVF